MTSPDPALSSTPAVPHAEAACPLPDAEIIARGVASLNPWVVTLLAELDARATRIAELEAELGQAVVSASEAGRLYCPRECEPPCDWTGVTEAELIAHYIERHHSPTEDAYDAACEALWKARADLARADAVVSAARALVEQTNPSTLSSADEVTRRLWDALARELAGGDGYPTGERSV